MKQLKTIIVVIAIILACEMQAQEMPRHAFCAAGGNYESVVMHVSWSIGQAEPMATIPQPEVIFSPGFQQYEDFTVSVQEVEEESRIQVFPNPCQDYAVLEFQPGQARLINYRLCDYSGRVVAGREFSRQSNSQRELIDLSGLSPGLYLLMVNLDEGKAISHETIKLIRN